MARRTGLLAALLLAGGVQLHAQRVVGPTEVYVSRQGNNPEVLNQGSYTAVADEGRSIKVVISGLKGPIKAEPATFSLMGPPCPTYDSRGRRTPATPAAPNTANFNGLVKIIEAQIPAAGTAVDAEFTAKDNGYWTKCAKSEKVTSDSSVIVKYRVNSIRIALSPKTVNLCDEDKKTVAIGNRFPADASIGTIKWVSLNGKCKILSSDATKAEIQSLEGGEDKLIATFTVNGAVYRDTATVNCNIIKFQKAQFEKPWVTGGTLDARTLLTDKSRKDKLVWSITKVAGNEAQIDGETGVISYPPKLGSTYTVTAQAKDDATCKATVKVVLMGFRVVLDVRKAPCDGEEAPLHIDPIPITLPKKVLAEFGEIKLESKTKVAFKGNPSGNEKLEFAALDANFKSKVLNCYWYSTGPACTWSSVHIISATAQVQGKEVSSFTKPELTISIQPKVCMEGFASATQTFTGAFATATVLKPGAWVATITGMGTFKRDPKGAVTAFKCPANSQFFKYIKDEENYHVGQIEGKNGVLCNDMWLVKNVTDPLAGKFWVGPNAAIATARMTQAILLVVAAENLRCSNLFRYPPAMPKRCAIEAEAKTATGIAHGYHMKCAYPLCK